MLIFNPFKFSSQKKKRKLLNFVGIAFHWLFSTLDENNKTEITDYIRQVQVDEQNIIDSFSKDKKLLI